MLALRLFFLLFIGANVAPFASTDIFRVAEPIYCNCSAIGFYDDNYPFLIIPQLKTESVPLQNTRPKPKVVYTFGQAKCAISTLEQLSVSFQYLRYNHTIDLKLARHSISYPFHSFP